MIQYKKFWIMLIIVYMDDIWLVFFYQVQQLLFYCFIIIPGGDYGKREFIGIAIYLNIIMFIIGVVAVSSCSGKKDLHPIFSG